MLTIAQWAMINVGVSDYPNYKPENDDYNNLYQGAEYLEGEDGELSWFNAGVRVGVGIGLSVCLGIGIGVGLLSKTQRKTISRFPWPFFCSFLASLGPSLPQEHFGLIGSPFEAVKSVIIKFRADYNIPDDVNLKVVKEHTLPWGWEGFCPSTVLSIVKEGHRFPV
ncbi:hypothetical protein TEA_023685 [Camellia sinensis var. sinensis]|uniref:Uncharacterized protein n=1 Tax=Camellia sinensis var. sinensis TaxID=542762 RepID=A0A4S4DUR2_CAMSN|nr:hypothetical protein TEA_023685 [Camellia sinensis var. sinensis]